MTHPPKSVCIAPAPRASREHYRIERGDYSSGIQNQPVYFREPPSSTASDSHRTDALPAQHVMGGKLHPLSPVGGRVCRVCCPIGRSLAARWHH
jgi:hypothetical protein